MAVTYAIFMRNHDITHAVLLALLSACTPRAPYVASTDTAAPADTREDSDTGLTAEPPWPTISDNTEPLGKMPCEQEAHPCNHQIRLGVGDGAGQWSILEAPLALHASVANVVPVDYGEWDGAEWGGLWVSYVDVFPGNLPDDSVDNVLTVATLAFPWDRVKTPEGLAEVLRGEGPYPWVFHRTDTWQLGFAIVDPERELIEVGGTLRHLLLVIDLDLDVGQVRSLYLLDSDDGIHFSPVAQTGDSALGTDPDCHPIGWDGVYPGPLPEAWGPEGDGEWACNIAGPNEFSRYEGSLIEQSPTGETVRGITVTATAHRDGVPWSSGHVNRDNGLMDMVEVSRDDAGWGTPSIVLRAGSLPGTEGGIQAPTRITLAPDVELLTFHELIEHD